MGSITKKIILKVPLEVIYEAIKFINTNEEWYETYFQNFFDFSFKKGSILIDEPFEKFIVRIEEKENYLEYRYYLDKIDKYTTELTITHRYHNVTDNLDKMEFYNDITTILSFELGYHKGKSRY
ncbi:MAG: hypothetical protein ACOC56_05925 [Atribacterota bacterium]